VRARRGATDEELRLARTDVLTGMAFSNLVMYFIILATGATLYVSGQRDIQTARQAAEALKPLAGPGAYWLFTLGLIGTGMLGVPVLAGSGAYAVSEAMHWRGSLEDRPRRAPRFYAVLAVAVLLGLVLNYLKLNAVRMLFWAAVLNGMLAPPLIILVTLLSSDRSVMGERINPFILTILGWLTAAVMLAATVMMFVAWGR
jgi:Mn2+/Fe2+ NRAMP family transporter